jgi:D-sedoheptulose 7-phosphate isomerase
MIQKSDSSVESDSGAREGEMPDTDGARAGNQSTVAAIDQLASQPLPAPTEQLIALYLRELTEVVAALPVADITAVAEALLGAWRERRTVFIAGNGGSAAAASHMMNDLSKFCAVPGRPRFRALALTDNVPWLTAVANDQSYNEVFVEPLRGLLQPGDWLVAISASGNSPNLVAAVDYAQAHGARVIGLCGRPGGRLAQLADLKVIVPSDRIGQQEDGHVIINHVLAFALRARLEAEPPA